MMYPRAYHDALNHLIEHGFSPSNHGRTLMARALWALRAKFGRERARRERLHMLYIVGMWPEKDTN